MQNAQLSKLIITRVVSTNRINAKTNTKTLRTNRNCWGIAMKQSGSTDYTCGGVQTVSTPNRIVILPKGVDYTWISHGGSCFMIEFEADTTCSQLFSFGVKDNSKLVSLFHRIEHNLLTKQPFYEMKCINDVYGILLSLAETGSYMPTEKQMRIQRSVEYLLAHYGDPGISNQLLSEKSGLSEVYFRKLFTELHGCPPMEFLQNLRLNKAAELLSSDHNSVETIATSVGYNSVYHFSKMFKKHFGISPSQFNKPK